MQGAWSPNSRRATSAADDGRPVRDQGAQLDRPVRRQKSIEALLETAVRQVREFTGFDRVMAYRFRATTAATWWPRRAATTCALSRPALPGRRHPAQARRLYVLNTLRMIADVGYHAVPLLGAPGARRST
jgi:chemotaxis family two-component system sensor kinase Cph1